MSHGKSLADREVEVLAENAGSASCQLGPVAVGPVGWALCAAGCVAAAEAGVGSGGERSSE